MSLLRLDKASLAYGHRPLLRDVDLEIERGERVCLLGRNGEGKTSLLRLVAGEAIADDGSIWIRPGTRVSQLAQEAEIRAGGSVYDLVVTGLGNLAELVSRYHQATIDVASDAGPRAVQHLASLQDELEEAGGWELEQKVETVMSRLGLDGEIAAESLSGGWRRRAMLARALVSDPDILLLDEPTNHLDLDAIAWLEDVMMDFRGALLFVSHDRAFIRRLATRIVELDRGVLSSWSGDYDNYLRRKAEQIETEARHDALFDKKLSQEEAWIRKGIKARRTRNEGRVRELKSLREKRRQRIDRLGQAKISLDEADQSGKIVFDLENASFAYDSQPIVDRLTLRIMRGDRIGLIGPNGTGKSTLIKLLLGDLAPDSGVIRRGTRLEVAYFDQQRMQLEPERSVMDNVAQGSQTIVVGGRQQHVAGYLQRFLFAAERLNSPVSSLSGGERNRLLLARLFSKPANLLVLDEPTNDLDVDTLELLEELISDFEGTVLLVSHDRVFLDNIVTSTLAFDGSGTITEYVGGYSDWRQHQDSIDTRSDRMTPGARPAKKRDKQTVGKKPAKLSYKDQRELETLPAEIEALEREQATLHQAVNREGFYARPKTEVDDVIQSLKTIEENLLTSYKKWEYLDNLSNKNKPG
ncbi:MAG: ATP-binding cassette domain-containing protein [Gammaproteobacteria bacterium]